MRRLTVTLLLPVLNEIEGLKRFLPAIDRSLFDDIVIMDGNSTDGSQEYALSQGVRVFTQLRKGLANGYFDIFRALDTDYIVLFSPDGNCLIENLPQIVAKIHDGYDLVVVSRYLPPARSDDDTLITAFGNRMFSLFVRFLGAYPVSDALTIYRGVRRDIVLNADFERMLYGPVFEPLTTSLCILGRRRMIEIPGNEPKRIGGRSKMSVVYNGSCLLLMVVRLYLQRFLHIRI